MAIGPVVSAAARRPLHAVAVPTMRASISSIRVGLAVVAGVHGSSEVLNWLSTVGVLILRGAGDERHLVFIGMVELLWMVIF